MALPDSFLQELKLKTDIEDVISSYVTLRRRGSTCTGLCPFHNEKTPSFTVYTDTQSFYCFGCGAGGDAITFVKKIENLDYFDAVKLLAQRAGIQMPEDGYDDSLGKKRRAILEINREAARFYYSYMMSEEGKAGLRYFTERGLTGKTLKKFGLGYAPNEWDRLLKHLKEKGYSIGDMLEAGVVARSRKGTYYDFFKNRAMFPIIDIRGNVVGFSGRIIDDSDKRKYINTGETLVYKKTNEVFGLNIAKDSGSDALILCEGNMDVVAMNQAGFTNCIAGCGTALTSEQVRLISRYAKEVILCYDNDDAGRKALNKAITLFEKTDLKIRIPSLRGGKDPDEIIKNLGADRFRAMLDSSSNEIEYALLNLRAEYDLRSIQGKNDFMNSAIKLLARCTPIEQDLYLSKLCEELKVEKQSAKAQLKQYKRVSERNGYSRNQHRELSEKMRAEHKESYEKSVSTRKIKAEDRLIALLMRYPDCLKYAESFERERLTAGFIRKVYDITERLINDSVPTDFIHYSEQLTDSELGRLTGIVARSSESLNPKMEFRDCLKVINEEFESAESVNNADLNDDETFLSRLNKLSNN
ncbi:MAG: DNA primase [Eubacterium sp.]|nr:DNA primase [Eubacterium sp.]